MPSLDGKIIVIIGGTSGIGLSAATAFIAHGAKVVAVGRADEHLAKAKKLLGKAPYIFATEAMDSTTAPARRNRCGYSNRLMTSMLIG